MKKVFLFLTMAAAVSAACTKSELRSSDNKPIKGNYTELKFRATLENDGKAAPDSKTALQSDDSVLWTDGDKIDLIWNGGSAASGALSITNPAASAEFTVQVESGTEPVYAIYPSGTTASYDGSALSVTVSTSQDGTFGSAAIEAAKVADSGLAFKNLFGLVEISVNSSDVKSIILKAYGDRGIAGSAIVDFSGSIPSVSKGADTTSAITIAANGEGTYYAAVLPASLSDGLYIELRDGSDQLIGQKFTGKKLEFARRKLVGLGIIAASTVAGTFVTVSGAGTGDGSSWDNAMSWADLKTAIAAGTASGKFFLAGGTYTGTETAVKGTFSIYGGYDPASTGTDLSKRSTTDYPTAFDGQGSKRLFIWNASTITTSFDGATFTNAYTTSGFGSAIVIETAKSASFNNCKIDNNQNTAGGGAVRAITKSSTGIITFTDCIFSNNTTSNTTYGGALLTSTASIGTLYLIRCKFTDNANPDSNGGAIYSTASNLQISDCIFENNSAKAGGVIHISRGSATLTNNLFTGNSASGEGGAIYSSGGTITASGNTFSSNTATEGGAVFVNAATIYSSENTYSGNSITTPSSTDVGGGAFRIKGAATASFDKDIFSGNNAGTTSSANGSGSAIFAGILNGGTVYTVSLNKCYFENNVAGSRGTIRSFSPAGILMLNACSFYMNTVRQYASGVHSNGITGIHNCVFQANSNFQATGASTLYVGGKTVLVSNTSVRLSADSGVALYTASGTATIVNNTFVNSANDSGAEDKQAALKSKQVITSYGHNIYSKLYQETADTYSVLDADNHPDVQYNLTQQWVGEPYYVIRWTQWNDGGDRPAGFVEASPARVAEAIDAFDADNSCAFKAWLESLSFSGGNALQTDHRGTARSTTAIWPGSYDNSATTPLP